MPKMSHKAPRGRGRTLVDLLRAVGSLTLLLALLTGLPVVLYTATVRFAPAGLAQLSSPSDLFTRPDSGAAFLLALVAVGWIGWISFAASVLLEIPAQLRGRAAPRLPGIGWSQQVAGALVGSILLLGPTAGGALAASTSPDLAAAAPAAATAPLHVTHDTSARAITEQPGQHTYTVQETRPADSLWSIAANHLGDGARWHEIAALNEGRTMPDGTVFHEAAPIQPGWVLIMPADASVPSGPHTDNAYTDDPPTDAAHTVTVHSGDTLSEIAEEEMGNADRYPQLFAANEGRSEPGGAHLTDPDTIFPGWTVQIPDGGQHTSGQHAAGTTEHPGDAQGGTHHSNDTTSGAGADNGNTPQPDSGGSGAHRAPSASAEPGEAATATPQAPTSGARPPQQPPGTHAEPSAAGDAGDSSALYTAVAATSLFAAAVLAVLGGRRALQQRRRRPRQRIPLPPPATATAGLEKQLRVEADIDGLDLVSRALRTLASNCARTSRPLPPLEAVRVTARGLELHLSAPTPTIAPFSELDDHPDRWWCPAHGAALLDVDEARDITAPYPALVSFGETEEHEPVLVNLESVGLVRLTGARSDVLAVVLGMAVELASSALSDDATIVLAGAGEELTEVFPVRIEHHPDLTDAIPGLRAHDALQRNALAVGDFDSLDQARLHPDGGDTWVPTVVLAPDTAEGETAEEVADLLASRPRTATAVITRAGSELDSPGAWTLSAVPGAPVHLPGLDLSVTLQRLDEDAYQPLLHLLATAARTDDVPAPAWTHAPDGDPAPNGPSPLVGGDSALAQDAVPRSAADSPGEEEEHDDEPYAGEPTPIVQVSVETDHGSLATAVPSFSALAPTVTGAEPADEPVSPEDAAEGPVEHELFDAALQDVLDERAEPSDALDDDDDAVEPEGLDELTAVSPQETKGDDGDSGLSPAALGSAPSAPQPANNRPSAKVTAVNSGVLVALNIHPDPPAAPQIRLLGAVDVIGTLGRVESNRRNGLTEIAAWLALHPGKSRHELDEAIWPGQRILADTRNTNVSKLRTWLGRDPLLPADDPNGAYLPPISDGVYAFNDQVTSDWSQFQDLYQQGMHSAGTAADIALAGALALVRGRPLSDIDPSKYAWAEYDIQEMISAVVDVAHELATRRLGVRDYRAATAAASRGLVCDQQSELLYRDLFTIYSETGDRQGLERTAHQLSRIAVETGCDAAPETVALVNALMHANRIATA